MNRQKLLVVAIVAIVVMMMIVGPVFGCEGSPGTCPCPAC